ncbi:hypothetical protein F511_09350 [Dorcoceras hygrometricum]|uniref:Uncharacterized protein n=1 Tax=Dorcoceras hygrometricum TaxID=472368 RepID=A0A2Z7C7X3_9LAMI|nr:hypothetical protein F511_09350 [Dorcoceras hygrometricum]
MAPTLINNAIQIYFESVYGMADAGMVQMFKALESSGLRGFLGCSSTIYEAALVEFFQNASVRDDKVVSTVQGKSIFISEELKTSCRKREMKFEFRLLNDILAKTVTVKAGSFDAVTHKRFLMMSAIHGGVKICILLKGAPDLNLGESKDFPPLKILAAKTIGTYVSKNKNITVEEVVDEPVVKVAKKAVTKRRPAPAVVEPDAKNKRKTVIKETTEIAEEETDLGEPVVMRTVETIVVETEKEKEKEKEKEIEPVADEGMSLEKILDSTDTEPLSKIRAYQIWVFGLFSVVGLRFSDPSKSDKNRSDPKISELTEAS